MLGIISKNTILKAIHNQILIRENDFALGIISKNTILKAIHNPTQQQAQETMVGNYK